jgi:hypothetical protein
MENLEDLLAREGVEVETSAPPISASFQFTSGPSTFFFLFLGAAVVLVLTFSHP